MLVLCSTVTLMGLLSIHTGAYAGLAAVSSHLHDQPSPALVKGGVHTVEVEE